MALNVAGTPESIHLPHFLSKMLPSISLKVFKTVRAIWGCSSTNPKALLSLKLKVLDLAFILQVYISAILLSRLITYTAYLRTLQAEFFIWICQSRQPTFLLHPSHRSVFGCVITMLALALVFWVCNLAVVYSAAIMFKSHLHLDCCFD